MNMHYVSKAGVVLDFLLICARMMVESNASWWWKNEVPLVVTSMVVAFTMMEERSIVAWPQKQLYRMDVRNNPTTHLNIIVCH